MKSIVISLTFYNDRKKISMVSEESVWKHGGEKEWKTKRTLMQVLKLKRTS